MKLLFLYLNAFSCPFSTYLWWFYVFITMQLDTSKMVWNHSCNISPWVVSNEWINLLNIFFKENGEIITDWSLYKHLGQLKGKRINADRLYHPLISFLICIAVLVYSELSNIGFASYLLYVLVGNVLGTTLYYVGIMKVREWLQGAITFSCVWQQWLYIICASCIGSPFTENLRIGRGCNLPFTSLLQG